MFERPRGRKVREREISLLTPEPPIWERVPAGDAPEERSADEEGTCGAWHVRSSRAPGRRLCDPQRDGHEERGEGVPHRTGDDGRREAGVRGEVRDERE